MVPLSAYTFNPIGKVHSCFKEKFGIPRQPGLVAEACATVELLPPYDDGATVRGLTDFSHIWLLFVFHANTPGRWRPTVRPPRLGGNQRMGVFASRAAFRPNPIGQSVVQLDEITHTAGRLELQVSGVDLLDQTPVLDIKPYLPYADALPLAKGGYADERPAALRRVTFSDQAKAALAAADARQGTNLRNLVKRLLEIDPRPAYRKDGTRRRTYGMHIEEINIEWELRGEEIFVTAVSRR